MLIEPEIIKILQPDFIKFYKLLRTDEEFKILLQDKHCEGEDDFVFFLNQFIQGTLEFKAYGVKLLYEKLVKGGYCKLKTNRFIYAVLKLKHKTKEGLWSWAEIDEYDIPLENIKKTTTKYTIE
jgi:hypothetical protein